MPKEKLNEAAEHTNEELVALIRDGASELMPQLFAQVKRFIFSYASSYWNKLPENQQRIFSIEDFKQCGWLALCDAVKTYSNDFECSFASWLSYYLHREFTNQRGHKYHVNKDNPDDRKQYYQFTHPASTEDQAFQNGEDDGPSIGDIIPDPSANKRFEAVEDAVYIQELHAELERNIDQLPERQQTIVRSYYFEAKPLTAIAKEMQITPSWAAEQRKQALKKMKANARRKTGFQSNLASYLDQITDFYHSNPENLAIYREWMRRQYLRQHPDEVITPGTGENNIIK